MTTYFRFAMTVLFLTLAPALFFWVLGGVWMAAIVWTAACAWLIWEAVRLDARMGRSYRAVSATDSERTSGERFYESVYRSRFPPWVNKITDRPRLRIFRTARREIFPVRTLAGQKSVFVSTGALDGWSSEKLITEFSKAFDQLEDAKSFSNSWVRHWSLRFGIQPEYRLSWSVPNVISHFVLRAIFHPIPLIMRCETRDTSLPF